MIERLILMNRSSAATRFSVRSQYLSPSPFGFLISPPCFDFTSHVFSPLYWASSQKTKCPSLHISNPSPNKTQSYPPFLLHFPRDLHRNRNNLLYIIFRSSHWMATCFPRDMEIPTHAPLRSAHIHLRSIVPTFTSTTLKQMGWRLDYFPARICHAPATPYRLPIRRYRRGTRVAGNSRRR